MSTLPGPGKAKAAAAAPDASSRLMELLGVRPRSAARGVMVSSGRERAPSIWVGVVSFEIASVHHWGGDGTEVNVIVVRK